jgi:hypothetical protein
LLILRIRTAALRRRLKEIEQIQQAAHLGGAHKLTPAEEKKLNSEDVQIRYDINMLKQWDTAVPVMEGM